MFIGQIRESGVDLLIQVLLKKCPTKPKLKQAIEREFLNLAWLVAPFNLIQTIANKHLYL